MLEAVSAGHRAHRLDEEAAQALAAPFHRHRGLQRGEGVRPNAFGEVPSAGLEHRVEPIGQVVDLAIPEQRDAVPQTDHLVRLLVVKDPLEVEEGCSQLPP
jgi:hypothetical protein